MTNLKQNILLPKNNAAFKRLLEANPELLHDYVDELVGFNGGSYAENMDAKGILNIVSIENVIGSNTKTVVLLRSNFIGVN